MSFPSTITLVNAAAQPKDFVLNLLQGSTSERITIDSNLTNPVKMGIRHSFVPKRGLSDPYDRHIVQFSKQVTDADDLAHMSMGQFSLIVPRVTDITRVDINDIISFTRAFLAASANVDAFLRNES